jgi:hypothetical protein
MTTAINYYQYFVCGIVRFAKENSKPQDADRLYNMFLTNQYVQNESSKTKTNRY